MEHIGWHQDRTCLIWKVSMYVLSSCSYGKEYRVSLGQDICNFVGWPHTSYTSIPMERNIGCHRDRKCVIWRGVHVCHVSPEICLYKACWNSLTVGLISQPKVSEIKHGWNKPRSILNQKVKKKPKHFFLKEPDSMGHLVFSCRPSSVFWWRWWRRQDAVIDEAGGDGRTRSLSVIYLPNHLVKNCWNH